MKTRNLMLPFALLALVVSLISLQAQTTLPFEGFEGAFPEAIDLKWGGATFARASRRIITGNPAVFIENQGQWADPSIRFALHSRGVQVGLGADGVQFRLPRIASHEPADREPSRLAAGGPQDPAENFLAGPPIRAAATGDRSRSGTLAHGPEERPQRTEPAPVFSARFVGARPVQPAGVKRSTQIFHYHVGEPARWRENVGSWEELVYRELYPGIDLHLSGKATGLKYEFRLAPGADWRQVKVRYEGIERLKVRDDGALAIHVRDGMPPLMDGAPVIYQEIDGRRIDVTGRFVLVDDHTYGFAVTGHYDPALPLVIDPIIDWGSYVGDQMIGGNTAYAVAVDHLGNVLLTGESPYFVAKVSPTGAHVWSAYLGTGSTTGNDIAVDEQGNVLVVGSTTGSGWMSGGYDTSFGGMWDGFVVKLSPGGQHLWSTYLGGTNVDFGFGIDTDEAGNVLVVGQTSSSHWVGNGSQTVSGVDGFLVKLNSNGVHLASTYLADFSREPSVDTSVAYGVVSGEPGRVLVAGLAEFCQFIEEPPMLICHSGSFVMEVSVIGAVPEWTTEVSGASRLALDSSGNVVVAGSTSGGNPAASVTKLDALGVYQWSVSYPGTNGNYGTGVAVDAVDNVLLVGHTESANWASGGFNTNHHGRRDAFIAKISPAGNRLWSAYYGGTNNDYGNDIAIDGAGNLFLVGETGSTGWFTGGFDTTLLGASDAFVVKLRPAARLQVNLSPAPAVSIGASWRRVGSPMWLETGAIEPAVVPGQYTIEFKDVPDWNTPVPVPVTLVDNQSLTRSATYHPLRAELSWASYVGGNAADFGEGIATDAAGNVFMTGRTSSSGWVSGGYDTNRTGSQDAFVVKWSAEGAPLWSTYLGGDSSDQGLDIAVDGAGNVLVAGLTTSAFWARGGYDTNYDGGNGDAFVAKLSPAGAFLWSSYLGGSNVDYAYAVAVDRLNNVLVAGITDSSNWVSGSFDPTHNGGRDAFAVKLSPAGAHVWSTFLGGTNWDWGYGIAADSANNVVVTGDTSSPGWIVAGFDTSHNGFSDGFVFKLNPAGSHLWATYLGGTNSDQGRGVSIDPSDNILVTGGTDSANWISGGFDVTQNGSRDAFVFKLSPGGAAVWSTYLGGSNLDTGNRMAIDREGNAFITGQTLSSGWTASGFDSAYHGAGDTFVAKVSSTGAHVWSTYLGGTNTDTGNGIALDSAGRVYVAGTTTSTNWISGGWDTSFNGGGNDAFVAAVTQLPVPLIRIRSIEPIPAGGFRIEFSVTADPAPAFVVERAGSLTTPIQWSQETAAVVSALAAGLFEARVPQRGGTSFYRIRVAAP